MCPYFGAMTDIRFVHIFFFFLRQSRTRCFRSQLGMWPSFKSWDCWFIDVVGLESGGKPI